MQLNYNTRFSKKTSTKQKALKFILYISIFLLFLFVLDKFNFPSPKKDIKKNITNEIIKLK